MVPDTLQVISLSDKFELIVTSAPETATSTPLQVNGLMMETFIIVNDPNGLVGHGSECNAVDLQLSDIRLQIVISVNSQF